MKKLKVAALGLSVLLVVGMAGSAFAGTRGKTVNCRQNNQFSRIGQGIRSGELTRNEAFKLAQNQRKINRYEQIARADGRINPREFQKLDRMQDRQNRAIYQQKHDRQDRNWF